MKKKISKLQYISSTYQNQSHVENIETVCAAGGKWIQLRLKNQPVEAILAIAQEARRICDRYDVVFILNDYPEIAKQVKADGVHLGKLDVAHQEARKILGKELIIGGTANTMEDIRHYAREAVVDYIGVGPFRFTMTKENLSPILGLEGYAKIVRQCEKEGINLPIIAIGGILLEDIAEIVGTGVYGIAVSGLLTKALNKEDLIQSIHEHLKSS